MIDETETENDSGAWKKFLKKHWTMFALFVVAAILASVGAIYVFLWFVGDAQSTGMVPSTLGLWTMGNMVTFIFACNFLGTSLNRSSCNLSSSGRLAVVEKIT